MLPYQLHQKLRQQDQKQKNQLVTSSSFDYKTLQKVFWIWDKKQHLLAAEFSEGQCCWNHIVGVPTKNNKEYPLFDYERILFNRLFVEMNLIRSIVSRINICGLRNQQVLE